MGPIVRVLLFIKMIKSLTIEIWRQHDVSTTSAMNTAREIEIESIDCKRARGRAGARSIQLVAATITWWRETVGSPEWTAATEHGGGALPVKNKSMIGYELDAMEWSLRTSSSPATRR